MDEQPVVFDETFNDKTNIRRRDRMPMGLKIYVWAGMVLGVLLFISPLILFMAYESGNTILLYPPEIMLGSAIIGSVLFTMTFLLWSEVKWAIRFNWVIIAIFVFVGIRTFVLAGPGLLLAPYGIWLFRIQKKWEK